MHTTSSVQAQYHVGAEDAGSDIVDADVIEAVKENIQPLQRGRRATALSAIFSTPHAQRDLLLSRKRTQFRLQVIQTLEDDDEDNDATDPLEVYSRFIAWTLESYPQGQSAESGLLELLEEATRKLKDRRSYSQDPRYLKLWALYADYVDKPAMIYAYLLANEIGTDMAQLYEDYAHILERDGRRREADEIYLLGIARRVEPLDHLKKRYSEFQRRMLAAPLPPPPSSLPGSVPPIVGHRVVLGETASRTHKPVAATVPEVVMAPRSNGRLQIFIDPNNEEAKEIVGNEWGDIGTRISRTKENRPEVHKMAAGPLSRSRGTQRNVSGPASRILPFRDPPTRGQFVPFRDEDEAGAGVTSMISLPATQPRCVVSTSLLEPNMTRLPPATPKPSFIPFTDEVNYRDLAATSVCPTVTETLMSLAPRPKISGAPTEAEALRRDPFKNYDIRHTDV
ncbi:Mad3/BUB1 homology region 1-domain-containing protein [Hysterangium stoloniferum]|nr:Mad3/BUB1 homology region 1-domain-containing protein [Hysterangium stoloniferum]